MALRKRTVEFPFGFGVDQGTHEIPLEGPSVSALRNGRINKAGGVEPRLGYATAATAAVGSAVKRVFGYRDALHEIIYATATTDNAPCKLYALNNGRVDAQGGAGMANAVSEATVFDRVPISRDVLSETDASDGGVDGDGECEQANPDFAVDAATNLIVIAWQQRKESNTAIGSVAVYAEVRDATTMAVVTPAAHVSSAANYGQNPRCINHNGNFYVVYDTSTDGDIRAIAYNQTTRAWGTDTVIAADLDTTGTAGDPSAAHEQIWDACELSGDEDQAWYLAYRTTTTDLEFVKLTGVTIASNVTIAEIPGAIGIYATGSSAWISWYVSSTTMLRGAVYTASALAVSLAPTDVLNVTAIGVPHSIGVVAYSATQSVITWTTMPTTPQRAKSSYITFSSSGVAGTACHKNAIVLVSRPIVVDSVVYANVLYDGSGKLIASLLPIARLSDGFTSVFTVALNGTASIATGAPAKSWRVVAPWMIGTAGGRRGQNTLSNFAKVRNDPTYSSRLGVYGFAATQEVSSAVQDVGGTTVFNFGANGIDFCRMQFDASDRFKAVEFGPNLVIAGGVTSVFDGARVGEYGFWWPPENGLAGTPAASGALSAGNYSHAACYEYKLATGDLIQSAPALLRNSSGSASYAAAASQYIDLSVHNVSLTQRFDAAASAVTDMHASALIRVYRTEANGEIYYRDPAEADTAAGTYTLANDPFATAGFNLTSGDDATDADSYILANPALYTTGGALPNYPAPAVDDLVVHKGRLWGISSEDKKELVFTHYKEAGELPGFHPFLTLRIDEGGGAVALAVLDEKLVVFKRDAIYVVHGDGPDRKGVGSTFQVVRVHTEHGCRDRRSVVNIPQGIMFASRTGICLLGRGFQVEFVGAPVEDDEEGVEYVAATALPDREQVYFQCREPDLSGSVALVYHWDSGQWACDDIRHAVVDPDPAYSAQVPVSATFVNGTYYLAATTLPYVTWSHSGHLDCTTAYIPLTLTTPWLKVSGLQGYGRCWWASLIGDHVSAHGLTATVAVNYAGSVSQTVAWTEGEVTALDRYQLRIHIYEQKGEAFRFSFTTTLPAGSPGAQCIWNGIALEIGTKGGVMRRPDSGMRG